MTRGYRVTKAQLQGTFSELRRCGRGRRECQVAWLSSWGRLELITRMIHVEHSATAVGFELADDALTRLWRDLAHTGEGIRVQIHTHPGAAFHSVTDDRWPLVHTPGFLSLVIPSFAMGEVGFDGAHLVELDSAGHWSPVAIASRIEVVQ